MIPPFDDNGNLPLGVHPATFEEVEDRFGKGAELRHVQMQSVFWLADLARRIGAVKLAVNGSFVSDVPEPNDVDCALLLGPDYPKDKAADEELAEGLPFIQVYLLETVEYNGFVCEFYGTDWNNETKGVIEVTL